MALAAAAAPRKVRRLSPWDGPWVGAGFFMEGIPAAPRRPGKDSPPEPSEGRPSGALHPHEVNLEAHGSTLGAEGLDGIQGVLGLLEHRRLRLAPERHLRLRVRI